MIDTLTVEVAPPAKMNLALEVPAEVNVTIAPPAQVSVQVAPPAQVHVALSGTQGVSGPQGIRGVQGFIGLPATNALQIFEFVALLDGAQSIPLPLALGGGWFLLCVNGMRQAATDYTVAGDLLSLPAALNILAGDLISFEYYTPTT